MPKRTKIELEDVVSWPILTHAFWRAAKGKRDRADVRSFESSLDHELRELQNEVLEGTMKLGEFHVFTIRDPKVRTIHAPAFKERVLHHALMAFVEPVIEKSLVDDSFACRPGKGVHAAIRRAQGHSQRFPWYFKIDIRSFFASIDHRTLMSKITRLVKGQKLLELCERIIDAHHTAPGKGLPIGALTSQHFANLYLSSLDRLVLNDQRTCGMVRYMDDVTWWARSRRHALEISSLATKHAEEEIGLKIRPDAVLQRSDRGLTLCGYRIFPDSLRLTRRRRRRFQVARHRWESAFRCGLIDDLALQSGIDSAYSILAGADSRAWRRAELQRNPGLEA